MLTYALSVCVAATPTTSVERVTPVESRPAWVRGGAELGMQSLPQTGDVSSVDSFLAITPMIGFGNDSGFVLELGAPLRLGLNGQTLNTPLSGMGSLLRKEDWDERSDFGQLLRQLKVGEEGQSFHLQAGSFTRYTLGHGHLINRYSNQDNPNYHPAGAHAEWVAGPVRTQAFASDILAARLLAVDVSTDLGRIFSKNAAFYDSYHVSVSAARDFGAAGGDTRDITLSHLDLDAVVYRQRYVQLTLLAGAGARLFAPPADFGWVGGAVLDAQWDQRMLSLKFELRRQGGLFRQGLFGPNHELGRFAGLGFSQVPISEEMLPSGISAYSEARWSSGPMDSASNDTRLWVTGAIEVFASQRVDADVQLGFASNRRFSGALRASAVGMGVAPRYAFLVETRYRFVPALYGLAHFGNVYMPQSDGSLARGMFTGLALGLDFES